MTTASPSASHSRSGHPVHHPGAQDSVEAQVVESLRDVIEEVDVRTRLIDRVAYASDASHYYNVPKAVILASDATEVAHAFAVAQEHDLSVTLRSGGTSLSGQASGDGLLVDVRRGFRNMSVQDNGRIIRVQPGMTVAQVNARLSLYNRKLGPDPASESAATIGGVVNNNSSGMACGTEFNTYQTLRGLTLVLPSGTIIDTSAEDADEQLHALEPELAQKLLELQRRVKDNPKSVEIIQRHFSIKNTMGYGLNSFVDFEGPAKILEHLVVGSEGTLAFVAEAVFETIPVAKLATTTVAVFSDLHSATSALPELVSTGAATLELMDAASIRVGQTFDDAPQSIMGFEVDNQAAMLVEYHAQSAEELAEREAVGQKLLRNLELFQPSEFSTQAADRNSAWQFRKGLYAKVAKARPSGTTALLEDVAVPVERLANTCAGLQELFDANGYAEAVIFGHAKDGNIHFLLTDRFEGEENLARYNSFTDGMVDLILGAEGNLKAEHGTGRAMAPFVRRQYGDELYDVMQELKKAIDPRGILNPGVILDEDPTAHISNVKLNPTVEEEIDTCVECGYCEPVCPSKDLTLTPRQRIVVRRARATAQQHGDEAVVAELDKDYEYMGKQTCAVDSMCVRACPVGIDTGKFIKRLRTEDSRPLEQKVWKGAAHGWSAVNLGASIALSGAHRLPTGLVKAVTDVGRKLVGEETMPQYQPELPGGGHRRSKLQGIVGDTSAHVEAVYVPACVNAMFGEQKGGIGVTEAFIRLAERAGVALTVPESIDSLCCGTPWTSKGMAQGHEVMQDRVRTALADATSNGELPVIVDASSCTEGFIAMLKESGITVVDSITFAAEHLLDKLTITTEQDSVTIHPTCSAQHLGLMPAIETLTRAIATDVDIPHSWGCCGYAGDRGMLHPELTASATAREASEVKGIDGQHHVSSNRTCELGMTRATGKPYRHVLEIVELATR
ncbi:FAD-binding and (Fe-S)-binding domain-containing protein [Corynebacterium sp. L4756]|uniref:FAD-binding and (Fe-S)-binding domain-containing protein n=1 Tax=unclassified Corynebacterium TaxID=2624378 RepID=UPI00374CBB04